jgi:predicted metal-dependent phosphoesterase TrpH
VTGPGTAPGDGARPLRIDAHVHTRHSFDSSAPVGAVLDRAAAAGLDALAITDHDAVDGALDAAARARADDLGLVVLPGVEVSTADGHLLAIGVERRPAPGRPLAATAAAVRALGGVAVVPHPFQRSRHGARRRRVDLAADGVETYNAHLLTGLRNGQAAAFAREHGLPRFGGSDAHRPAQVGDGYTLVETAADDPGPADVLAAMRAGRTRAGGSRVPAWRYLGQVLGGVRRRTAGALAALGERDARSAPGGER